MGLLHSDYVNSSKCVLFVFYRKYFTSSPLGNAENFEIYRLVVDMEPPDRLVVDMEPPDSCVSPFQVNSSVELIAGISLTADIYGSGSTDFK
uniref:Xylanase inhibitor C-terminal domain-containing protein n=1 Tax=Setaria digitata TaxID=48799 RepID=A0A915PJI1_9BILA